MIPINEARKIILDSVKPVGKEKVDLISALGRVLAENIYSKYDLPPRDNSAMDGFAVKAKDTRVASEASPAVLQLIEEIPAGSIPEKNITSRKVSKIMTGGIVPDGADAVVMVENTKQLKNKIYIYSPVIKGENIRKKGEDIRKKELVLKEGTVVRPSEVGMLASLGESFILVYQRPKIAILATGDELCDIEDALRNGNIHNSNTYSLIAQVLSCGGIPVNLGIARDKKKELVEKLRMGLSADIIISSAGVSVGEYDYVREAYIDLGIKIIFWKVAMKPGKPLTFGIMDRIPVFGLPGNPVSSMVSFEQFVRPTILKMSGHRRIFRPIINGISDEIIDNPGNRTAFIRVKAEKKEDRYHVKMTGEQGSGILKSMCLANALAIIPPGKIIKKGEAVDIQILDNSMGLVDTIN